MLHLHFTLRATSTERTHGFSSHDTISDYPHPGSGAVEEGDDVREQSKYAI